MKTLLTRAISLLAVLLAAACRDETLPGFGEMQLLTSPAGENSAQPFLTTLRNGHVLLSWLEARPDSVHELRYATWNGAAWSEPRTVVASRNFLVNWADFPSMTELPDGSIAVHWLERTGGARHAYDIRIALSRDGGKSWSIPVTPHRDGTPTEHGFVSLFGAPDGGIGAVWLDGRNFFSPDGNLTQADMTLYYTHIEPQATSSNETLLDGRTCECCQTDAAITDNGPVVVYRDRSADEIRDIVITRWSNSAWTEPASVHEDGWKLEGCPVNGPAVAARGENVAVAWFTAANDSPRVNVAFSTDGGHEFNLPVRADEGHPVGRVDLVMLDDGSVIVSWLERAAGTAEIRLRHIASDRQFSESILVADASEERASGFPRMARLGQRMILAWTHPGRPNRIRVAVTTLK